MAAPAAAAGSSHEGLMKLTKSSLNSPWMSKELKEAYLRSMPYGPPKPGSPEQYDPDPDWVNVKSEIDSRIDDLLFNSCAFLPKDCYSDLDAMAIYQRLDDWAEHGSAVPDVVTHLRAIVKNHCWASAWPPVD